MGKTKQSSGRLIPAELGKKELLAFYRQMFLLRRFEKTAQALLKAGVLPGFIHLYVGEEATAVGIIAHLRRDDWITSTHRGHGHALAKGVPSNKLMAELAGKSDGCCGGRGGTMHLYDPEVGLFGTNGIVGGGIPSAVGLGLSALTRGTDQVAVSFFGDGASNLGAFHESLNFAGIQNAPVIFVCENNLYATATPLAMTTRNPEIATRAAAYGIPGVAVDGNSLLELAIATLEKQVEEGHSVIEDSLVLDRSEQVTVEQNGLRFSASARGMAAPDIDVERVKRQLRGKTVSEAETLLAELLPLETAPLIEVQPSGWDHLPWLPARMEVHISSEVS